jgi:predicted TPR repeat methyltransferase
MEQMDSIRAHDQEAAEYDQQVRDYRAYGHDVLFGMAFEYVRPHETLLDLGIGTGLASWPFAKAGLKIYGLDGSAGMLQVCESKAFAEELKRFDLRSSPLPYPDDAFDHVISCGVFHFFDELDPVVEEISRVIRPGGVFAFSIAGQTSEEQDVSGDESVGYRRKPTPWGVSIYAHSVGYIEELLQHGGFETMKAQKILMWSGKEDVGDLLFEIFVTQALRQEPTDCRR